MQVQPYVAQVQTQLSAAASLGDESTRAVADALAVAVEPAVRLAVLSAVSAAADEITAALLDVAGAPAVTVRIDGDDLQISARAVHPPPATTDTAPAADDADATARISLRLPESLKSQIDDAARAAGVSTNAWLLRALARSVAGDGERNSGASRHRITGWINA